MKISLILLALLLMFGSAGATNRDPVGSSALQYHPYEFGLGWDGQEFINLAISQGRDAIDFHNTSGGSQIPQCGLDLFKWYLNGGQSGFRAIIEVSTHGNSNQATHEAFRDSTNRETAWTYHLQNGWSTTEIIRTQSVDGYGIGIKAPALASLFDGGHQELVIYHSCHAYDWLNTGYNDARCEIGCVDSDNCLVSYFLTLFNRLDGQEGLEKRAVNQALSGLTYLGYQGNGETVLAACVTNVLPAAGTVLTGNTQATVSFDTEMDNDLSFRWPVVIGDNALVDNVVWYPDYLEFTLIPYRVGPVTVEIQALSKGVNELDGNQVPVGTNGQGPSEDHYVFSLTSAVDNPNTAVSFEGAGAFSAEDGTHVWWVTDPELGSQQFEVYGGVNRSQLLASVPASGGPDRSYFYELVVPPSESYEVVEIDNDPTTEYSTRPFYPSGPPANLDLLRSMNAKYGTWTPWVWEEGGRDNPIYEPTNFVYYSSRSDFLDLCQPVIDWWEGKGFTSQVVTGTENPYDCQAVAEAVYNAAIEHELPWLPFLVIVGEANQGSVPAYNIVGTIYVDDEDDQCYWSSCASDASIVEFDGDKIPNMPWSRVPVHTTTELQYEVTSTMEYYGRLRPQSLRAVIFDGDLNPSCNQMIEPRATLTMIQTQLEAAGISTVMLNDSDIEDCGDMETRHDWACAEINAGITELLGNGFGTSRSILPGYFQEKMFNPVFTMADLPRLQRIVVEFPGCGMGDIDRDNPSYYPSIPKMYLTANPANGTTAVAWISHSRGGLQSLHLALARAYFEQRVRYLYRTVQENNFRAIRQLGTENPAARDYLLMAGAYGFPARIVEMYEAGATPETVAADIPTGLSISPNPVVSSLSHLSFGMKGYGRVDLKLYDIQGRCQRTLADRVVLEPGLHRIAWDGRDDAGRLLSAGVYYARLSVNRHDRAAAKFVLVR
ncbi:MAG: C25 family cysteine peptidase [Patescibacteria group bacterium]|nr:C25 family cysteine peptidase [Patescibacteria group bacterium]